MISSDIVALNRDNSVLSHTNFLRQNTQKNELLSVITSGLLTPVTVMKSNIQLLKKFCTHSDYSMVEESFTLCEDSVDNIFRFINSVSFISDTDQGKVKLKKKRFNLHHFLNQLIVEIQQSNLDISRINVDITASAITTVTDKYLLNSILINLLINALKFSRLKVDLVISEINDQLHLLVRDYGIGIPEDEIAEIFYPFVRASNAKIINGTGLGLSIVSRAVGCLDGAVYVKSIVGKGTEFKVIIPVFSTNDMNLNVKKLNSFEPKSQPVGMIKKGIYIKRGLDFNLLLSNGKVNTCDNGCNQIISTISHELRTPVAAIMSNIQLFKKFNYNINHSILKESFQLCEESITDVARFLDNIQLINGANKSRIHPTYSFFSVKRIIHHLYIYLAQMNLDFHRIKLEWDLKDREISSDQKYLNKILLNILSNALKFSMGKIHLIISTYNHKLSISVQDRGLGIPEEEIAIIFQPFYRASNVKHNSGIGLGLTIVNTLVEKLGGEIQLSSFVNRGTTIQIIIPYEQPT